MENILQRSIQIILSNQDKSGAYIASPNFSTYHYCWLRDSSFIAYSMDLVGEYLSAREYFLWVDKVIRKYSWKIDRILEKLNNGEILKETDFLHTRYTLSGEEANDEWLNFQLDGYGTWIWALAEHIEMTKDYSLLNEVTNSVQNTIRYLSAIWDQPNYDCWEENPTHLNPYTLAAIFSGIKAAQKMDKFSHEMDLSSIPANLPERIRNFTLENGVKDGYLVKSFPPIRNVQNDTQAWHDGIDASLLGVAIPYCMIDSTDSLILSSVARIESELHRRQGGVYRYLQDTYYGGGEWLLLTAWLGWYYAETGDIARATDLQHWVEDQSDQAGQMPEQVSSHLLSPSYFKEWDERWGSVANPLLWSHAMHIILNEAIKRNS